MCTWRDGEHRPARVLESRQFKGEWEYYVHYSKLNRRNDEWVGADRLDWDTLGEDNEVRTNRFVRRLLLRCHCTVCGQSPDIARLNRTQSYPARSG